MGSTPKSQAPSVTARNTPAKVGANVMLGMEKSLHAAIWLYAPSTPWQQTVALAGKAASSGRNEARIR